MRTPKRKTIYRLKIAYSLAVSRIELNETRYEGLIG